EIEEQAVLDYAGDQLEVVCEAGGVVDGAAGGVVDQVPAVGADEAPLGLADPGRHGDVVVGQDVGDAVGGGLVTEGDDLEGQGEAAERADHLGRGGDDEAAGARLPDQLLSQQGRAAALDEREAGADLVGAVDGQVDARRVLQGGQRQPQLPRQFGGGLRGRHAAQVRQAAG